MSAPINSPKLHVAIDRHSLYLLGWKPISSDQWWAFEENGQLPKLPGGGVRRINGKMDYEFLGLREFDSYNIPPTKLLADLSVFDGKLGDWQKKANAIMLIFLMSEALRFDSVMLACVNWLTGTWTMKFTDEIKARVKDWAHSTGRRDRDVLLEHLPSYLTPARQSVILGETGSQSCWLGMSTRHGRQGCSQSIFPDFRTEAGGSDDRLTGRRMPNRPTTQRV